ncbi:MAG TPA: acetyl-CoA carboxylase biotin carboxylase subunit [Candidatus Krumholzibacteria bacterium]|nr:acetyl-CoA carboxylase biotin carboxylase subunit [Candidatus Krumholzibacteria bacterium]HPD71714.1 acetyl-CoA carboxylase biotin carboxylase subunit [Candidatus Krumholzibacteria bacterium]HRY41353.1 acetyl-CoA carboxylase biotin carboxylase subunit [Candidatus Krumholzibacteria bacterium]
MFKKILVCNRGEIALRIMRTCKELGIECVAVHAEADRHSLHVKYADESVCVGKTTSAESYLKVPNLIAAAEITGAEAIHPGYGFLAENAGFAETVIENGFVWIGPQPDTIRSLGDKAAARATAATAGVPIVPGTGILASVEEALAAADEIGYPVLLKASAGGGGKGMRSAANGEELQRAFTTAANEAKSAFGDGRLYLEKYLARPRHVEIQILADSHGNVVHLGERDCSIQRRHQKLVEEAPSPAVSPALRARMGADAVALATLVNYRSAGTVEYLLDEDGSYYFMEMNTRIQVEHPVTEWLTGVDLVREQLLVAAGEPLDFRQEDVTFTGCAIECRVNAEDPSRGFLPGPGKVRDFHAPGGLGVRVDSHLYTGYTVPPYYDSLLAKIIVHGRDRTEAIARMVRALDESVFEGVPTSIPFHLAVLTHPVFQEGQATTRFLEEHGAELLEAMHVRSQTEQA